MDRLRIGVVGAGYLGNFHAENIEILERLGRKVWKSGKQGLTGWNGQRPRSRLVVRPRHGCAVGRSIAHRHIFSANGGRHDNEVDIPGAAVSFLHDLVLDRLQVWSLATCLHESAPQQKTAPRSGGAVPMVRPTASVQKWKLARTPTVSGWI